MRYRISYRNALEHYLDISLYVKDITANWIYLQLPAWRPGRYQLANFASNIRNLIVSSGDKRLPVKKLTKDRWKINCAGAKKIKIDYQYYAYQLDAGGSLLNKRQLYLNFINCLIFVEGRLDHSCSVELGLPSSYKIACALSKTASCHDLKAKNYYQLVDSPMIASDKLRHWSYRVGEKRFHLWFMGSHKLSRDKVIRAFKAFTQTQIEMMKGFPNSEYHFLYQFPARKIYHGVEHTASTVIALGPGRQVHNKRYLDFLGVSSHELFHVWNIKKIRPRGLLPYDFAGENYFEEGFVAEGFTTYYGDLFLIRSRVFKLSQYFKELNKLFKRHFENQGRFYASLATSSWDLWLDGYHTAAPARKVSIYTKGAIIGLMMDMSLRRLSDDRYSLDDLMRALWDQFGRKNQGYTTNDIQRICEDLGGQSFNQFMKDFVYDVRPVESELNNLLNHIGCYLAKRPSRQQLKRKFGIWGSITDEGLSIKQITQGSPAANTVGIGDTVTRINGKNVQKNINKLLGKSSTAKLKIIRQGREIAVKIHSGKEEFFPQYHIEKLPQATSQQQESFRSWSYHKY